MITETELKAMTVEQFDRLDFMKLAEIRQCFPKEYKRLLKKSIRAASPFRRHRRKTK